MKTKKFLSLIFVFVFILSVALLTACSNNSKPCTKHIDKDKNNICDVCKKQIIIETPQIPLSLTVKDDSGNLLSGIKISFMIINDFNEREEVYSCTTDSNGVATITVEIGDYTLSYGNLPLGFVGSEDTVYTITEQSSSYELTIYDVNPDGTEEKPFALVGDTTVTDGVTDYDGLVYDKIPANATIYYSVKGMANRSINIDNENVQIIYNGTTYSYENGMVSVPTYVGNRTAVIFGVKNLTNEPMVVTIRLTSLLGSEANPYIISELNKSIVAVVKAGTQTYYKYTVLESGTFKVVTTDSNANVMIKNATQDTTTEWSEGESETTISVTNGDEIIIVVDLTAPSSVDMEVVFSPSITAGFVTGPNETPPVPIG